MATRAFEQGKIITAIENLLHARVRQAGGQELPQQAIRQLYERLAKAGGFDTSGN